MTKVIDRCMETSIPQPPRTAEERMALNEKLNNMVEKVFDPDRKKVLEEKGHESKNKNGGVKNDAKKPRMSLVPQLAKYIIGKVALYGELKYDSFNWMDGFKWTLLADAIDRHYIPFLCGEDNDPESGLPHLAHLAWNAMAGLENCYLHPELDDRWKGWQTEMGRKAREKVFTPFQYSEYLQNVLNKKTQKTKE